MARQTNSEEVLNSYIVSGDEIKPGDIYGYKIVAVIYSNGSWAAYRGLSDWTAQEVANQGDKLDYETAKSLFPTIAEMYTWNS